VNNSGKNGNTSGATFYFTIPIYAVQDTNHIIQDDQLDKPTKNEIRKLKILVVENDKISEILITKIVDGFTDKVLIATTGVEAIEFCRKNPDIDLVLMDINMPEMDGYAATRKIREFNREVVIIAQTAYALEGDREKSIAAGCNDYISKPIKSADLKILVNQYFSEFTKT
jgi:CheY-like chemotaxis protein